jgi:hypothetical protein
MMDIISENVFSYTKNEQINIPASALDIPNYMT